MKGYRTLIFNLLAAIVAVLQATGAVDIGLTGNAAVIYGIAVPVANMILRSITNTSMGQAGAGK